MVGVTYTHVDEIPKWGVVVRATMNGSVLGAITYGGKKGLFTHFPTNRLISNRCPALYDDGYLGDKYLCESTPLSIPNDFLLLDPNPEEKVRYNALERMLGEELERRAII